jgi:hypothetical protein
VCRVRSALHTERFLVKLCRPFGIAGRNREPGEVDQSPGLRLIVGRSGEGFFEQLDGVIGLFLQYGDAGETVPCLGVFRGGAVLFERLEVERFGIVKIGAVGPAL